LFSLDKNKIYHQHDLNYSIYSIPDCGPVFGDGDLTIANNSDSNKNSSSFLLSSYGKNSRGKARDLSKEEFF
jgi:hypothetical protein